ncbi:serine/threonine/tyrosine-interacting-like protein 1 [Littorina saxatilis]|uniref:Serine/threonine/tyrosine-interacting-like protein 1 n=1 Tax=Littorina saxatilis TaxID=31220 RepID=A0AAN9AKS2_9CAEN
MASDGMELIEPNALYNMLQQATVYSCLSDTNYLLLIDARSKNEYNESHVVTSKKGTKSQPGVYSVPYDAELECKQNVVVYDSNTSSLKESNASAMHCGRLMWEMGSKNTVKILRGGYEEFSALYPFLRTQKILFMPREMDEIKSYPVEILQGFLYLGNWRQGNAAYIQKDLKIKAHVNVCVEAETFFKEPGPEHLHIQVQDSNDADLFSHFEKACSFIDGHSEENRAVLVFDNLGISRAATVVIAYIMKHQKVPLEIAYRDVQRCLSTLRPNRAFIEQLSHWEEKLFGARGTQIQDPHY